MTTHAINCASKTWTILCSQKRGVEKKVGVNRGAVKMHAKKTTVQISGLITSRQQNWAELDNELCFKGQIFSFCFLPFSAGQSVSLFVVEVNYPHFFGFCPSNCPLLCVPGVIVCLLIFFQCPRFLLYNF